MITQEEVKAILNYDPETGKFSWRTFKKGRAVNDPVGTYNQHNQLLIMIDYQRYLGHRLAWLYVYGKFPDLEIDHIDGDRMNNQIANLREITHSQNLMNSKIRTDNVSGCPGVCWDKSRNKWKVQISAKGHKRIGKHFASCEEAVSFYKIKANELFGEFAHADKVL